MVCLVLAARLLSGVAQAAPSVALVEQISAPADGREDLRAAVIQAVRGLGATMVPVPASTPVTDCKTADCYVRVGQATGADLVLRVEGSYAEQAYKLRFEVHDGKSGRLVSADGSACEICTLAEFYRAGKEGATEVCMQAFRESVTAPAAAVRAPVPVVATPSDAEGSDVRWPWLLLGGAGAVSIVSGAVLWYREGSSTCPGIPAKECGKTVWSGDIGQMVMGLGFAAAAVGTVGYLMWPAPRTSSTRVALGPGSVAIVGGF